MHGWSGIRRKSPYEFPCKQFWEEFRVWGEMHAFVALFAESTSPNNDYGRHPDADTFKVKLAESSRLRFHRAWYFGAILFDGFLLNVFVFLHPRT
jgi:hypothetical protein